MSGHSVQQAGGEQRARGAGGLQDGVFIYNVAPGALVEQAQRVAHAAVGQPGKELGGPVSQVYALPAGHKFKAFGYHIRVKPAEVEALAAGDNRRGDLAQLGGGEDEHEMFRRLLQYFEQRVESAGGEHVHLVHYVDALLHRGG